MKKVKKYGRGEITGERKKGFRKRIKKKKFKRGRKWKRGR